jgi:hypothetical protein
MDDAHDDVILVFNHVPLVWVVTDRKTSSEAVGEKYTLPRAPATPHPQPRPPRSSAGQSGP